MIINGQEIIETDNHLKIEILRPYFSAHQKYGWDNKDVGFGLSFDLVRKAHEKSKKILVLYKDYEYEISPITINNFYKNSKVKPALKTKGVSLVIVPFQKFTRLIDQTEDIEGVQSLF